MRLRREVLSCALKDYDLMSREQITREDTPMGAAVAHNMPYCDVRCMPSLVKCACHVF